MELFLLKSKYQFDLTVYQLGHEKCDSHHSYGPVMRDFFVLHFIIDGEGVLEVENKVFQLHKGDFFLVPKNKTVRYYSNEQNPYEYYWIGFSGIYDEDILKKVGFIQNDTYVMKCNDFNTIAERFASINDIQSEKSLRDNLLASSTLYYVLASLIQEDITTELNNDKEYTLQKIINYIEANYSDVDMAQLEKIANMHRSNIYRLFMNSYKVSPSEYILNYRLQKALFFLKNTDSSIKKIAIMTGFNESAYFCKIFKNKFKKTPSQARKLK